MPRPTTKSLRQAKRRAEVESSQPKKKAKIAKTATERSQARRKRQYDASMEEVVVSQDMASTSYQVDRAMFDSSVFPGVQSSEHSEPYRSSQFIKSWRGATLQFQRMFLQNEFGHACNVCDRLWFERDLIAVDTAIANFLIEHFPEEIPAQFRLCANCFKVCKSHRIPSMSKTNGYKYPPRPPNLPKLDPITERLISPRIPYMQIRRLRRDGCYGIIGQVINVPVDVNTMVKCLPRSLDDDYAFNVNLKKNLVHKSSYISGFVKKGNVEAWLRFLVGQPLYKHYNIVIDWSVFRNSIPEENSRAPLDDGIESFDTNSVPESELIHAMQQTMLWNEEHCLDIAPGQHRKPESLLFDNHAEELSFPAIYFGVPRIIQSSDSDRVRSSAYTMSTSEIRRSDRRGVTPQHVLYMAMKILRFRVRDGVQNMFRCLRTTEKITRDMIEDREFVERLIDTNQAFLKTIPNSAQYWADRKKDLFAMIRQLGKPTVFLTLSASEIRWPHLLRILYRLSDEYRELGQDIQVSRVLEKLDRYKRAYLVAEDPVTCAIYFNKLVRTIMSILSAKKSYNPFGKHRVVDYFIRIEFQQRGSAHAHTLLWLENSPREDLSEDMPLTVQLITDLCSVDKNDLEDPGMIENQTHAHTFTCTKRGEQHCRFNIPYWPMFRTRVLVPLSKEDSRRERLKEKAKSAREKLETKTYNSIQAFISDINCNHDQYLDMVRSTLKRATVYFKRNMSQIFINTFNPWIASVLKSNMDLQIILDTHSCAAYVADYVNKSERGLSHLHRELTKIHEANPEFDQAQLLTKVSLKILNSVEMSAQEAAWYLLRQPMSWASRETIMIPTMWPHERYKARKQKSTMVAENLAGTSTDIWSKSKIQKYEERPTSLEDVTLAQYSAWFTSTIRTNAASDVYLDVSDENEEEERICKRRKIAKILRYRNYDKTDVTNHMREMVTLHVPFRNELIDIIDRDKYLQTFESNKHEIIERRREFEQSSDVDAIRDAILSLNEGAEDSAVPEQNINHALPTHTDLAPNDDDLAVNTSSISAIRPRSNVLSKEEYCTLLRKTNAEQRELILEVIHRLHEPNREPIQIFLTGPAGCGKTFTLKVLMETYNRYAQQHNSMNNAYIATATTGKAAVGINGVTVHSAFRLTLSRQTTQLSSSILQTYRHLMRNIQCVIIDEISMCGSHVFQSVNSRLQAMTGVYDKNFGGLDLFACGDLKQLPPVNATPVYTATRQSVGGRAVLWQSLDYYPLSRVMRQSDSNFSAVLTKIGCGEKLNEQEVNMIRSRFRTRQWCNQNMGSEVIRLFFNNKDVEAYNEHAISATSSSEIHLASDSYTGYATERERREAIGKVHRMKCQDTGSLPYSLTLTKGYPYMLTVNVDVEDGLVNGAIGKLRHIEECPAAHDNICSKRLWLEFDTNYVGRLRRVKYGPHIRSKRGVLSDEWVPIELRTVNIKVSSKIKCHRQQFPLLLACALTIHKSQGGTFNQIIYDYHKNHRQQLVYVALSRVTSLEGLFLTNATDDFTFYHSQTAMNPTIQDVQNEYKRLETHRLPTITTEMKQFLDDGNSSFIIVNLNVQSLAAHARDVTSDPLLSRADLLVLTETWMQPGASQVTLDGFEKAHNRPCDQRSGGVAVFNRGTLTYSIRSLNAESEHASGVTLSDPLDHVGDLIVMEIHPANQFKLILVSIYVHQGTSYGRLESFLSSSLLRYGNSIPGGDLDTPMVLMGDFNTTESKRGELVTFLEDGFALKLNSNINEKTTLSGTCIDLTFSRGLNLTCKSYISYFSHHCPVFNKISLDHTQMK